MNKRDIRAERMRQDNERQKRLIRRNWIVMGVSLLLAVFCYFFLDGILASAGIIGG